MRFLRIFVNIKLYRFKNIRIHLEINLQVVPCRNHNYLCTDKIFNVGKVNAFPRAIKKKIK